MTPRTRPPQIRTKRAYAPPEPADGFRVLVDRLWPRGLSRDQLKLDLWAREAAPSDALRKWFGHRAERWNEFARRYVAELEKDPASWRPLLEHAQAGTVTLVFSARDESHNNASVLAEFLASKLR